MSRMQPIRSDLPLLCLSHLRWDFVWQRPQHLMSRLAGNRTVFFVEERIPGQGRPRLQVRTTAEGVVVVQPHGEDSHDWNEILEQEIGELLARMGVRSHLSWYYTPMALKFSRKLSGEVTVYDCMDELKGFAFAPTELGALERELFDRADLVFTGGRSLYEAKRLNHDSVHCFPSSVDIEHFRRALSALSDPDDQARLGRPRIGYYGVIDERLDLALLDGVAASRPDWHLVMLGPVVKIQPDSLPRRPNIHYLGIKTYEQLPAYLAHWDVAMMPFAHNDATRFISPTKTPEYLAGGRPVVSVSLTDVVKPYGERGMVRIADGVSEFVKGIEEQLASTIEPQERSSRLERFLAGTTWDVTARRMENLILARLHEPMPDVRSSTPSMGAMTASSVSYTQDEERTGRLLK